MIATVDKTTKLLHQYGLHPQRKWGQNFLITPKTAQKIVDIAALHSNLTVIEIGPGLGALTQLILPNVQRYIGFEIDPALCRVLCDQFQNVSHFQLIQSDFLKADLATLFSSILTQEVVIISNLPYYLTSPILIKLLTTVGPKRRFITMMQKEVAKRIVHNQGGKDFNELSIFSQLFATTKYELDVSKNDFFPRPDVDSAIVSFSNISYQSNDAAYVDFIRTLFMQRRKTISNNLMALSFDKPFLLTQLAALKISPSTRAESLDLATLEKLYLHFKPYL